MKKYRNMLLIAVSFFIGAFTILATGLAFAHGGDTNLIHGCVRNNGLLAGFIRIVGANTNCNGNETALDWTKTAGSSESPISVGGGLSGRWEGSYTAPDGPCDVGVRLFALNLVEDSAGNITGSATSSDFNGTTLQPSYTTAGGKVTGAQIDINAVALSLQGTQQDNNNISGTGRDNNPACQQGTFSAQRVPLH